MPIDSTNNESHAHAQQKHTVARSNPFQLRESKRSSDLCLPALPQSFLQYSHVNGDIDRSSREHNLLFPSLSIHPAFSDPLSIHESDFTSSDTSVGSRSQQPPLADEDNGLQQSAILDSRVFEWLPRGRVPQSRALSSSLSLLPPAQTPHLAELPQQQQQQQPPSTALVPSRPSPDSLVTVANEQPAWSLLGSSSCPSSEYNTLDSQTAFGALQHNTINENSSFDVFFSLPTLAPAMPDETIAAAWPSLTRSNDEEKAQLPSESASQLVRYDERQSLLTRVLKNSIDHESINKHALMSPPEQSDNSSEVSDSMSLVAGNFFNPLGLGVPAAPFDNSAESTAAANYEIPSWITPIDAAFLNNEEAKRRRLDQETKAQLQQQDRINNLWQLLQRRESDQAAAPPSQPSHQSSRTVQPSSTAFPHHALPRLASTPTFTQATWETQSLHRSQSQVPDCSFVPNSIHSLALFEMMLMRVLRADELQRHYVVDEQLLVSQLLLMLHGISTPYFRWNPEDRAFELFPAECRLKDTSPAALHRLLTPLLRLGSQIKCLFEFAALQSVTGVGVVLHAFATGVEQSLLQYSLAIIQMQQTIMKRRQDEKDSCGNGAPMTLLELSLHLQATQSKMQYLSDLCGLPASLDFLDEFPRGAVLLSHLYTMCLSHECSLLTVDSNSLVLRSLFIRCLEAYMRIVEAWMFRGELLDPFQEFIVEWREVTTTRKLFGGDLFVSTDSNNGRQIRLAHRRFDTQLPIFFQHLEVCIFHAGQTVHLLQLYQPRVLRSVSAAQLLQQQLAMDMKRRQQRTSSLELQADEASKKRIERLRQQEDYARELRQQLSEKEAALAELAQRAASESAAEVAAAEQTAAIIAAERARLLAQIEAVRSPHSISGGLNPSLDWRTAREQLSPLRVKKLLQLEQEQVHQLERIVMPTLEFEPQSEVESKKQMADTERNAQLSDQSITVPTVEKVASTAKESVIDDLSQNSDDQVPTDSIERQPAKTTETALVLHSSTSKPSIQEPSSSVQIATASEDTLVLRNAKSDHNVLSNTIADASPLSSSSSPLQLRSLHFLSRELSEQASTASEELNDGEQFSTSNTEHALSTLSRQYLSTTASPLPILLQSRLFPALLSHASHVALLGVVHFERVHMCSIHFEVLRDYLLMQNGSVMSAFCEDLWQWSRHRMTTMGRVHLSDFMLHSMLENACKLRHSNSGSIEQQVALKHVSFRVDPAIHITLSDLKSWRAIGLNYATPYPLSLIIPKHTIQLYSRVFQFLLQLHHVEAELHEMWNLLRQSSTMASTTSGRSADRRHRMRVLECSRSEMAHFVHVLRGYCMTEVIESSWSVLKKKCETARSWMEMRDLHQDHISYVARACFRVADTAERTSKQMNDADENQVSEAADDDDGMNRHFSSPAFIRSRPSASVAAANHSVAVISSAIDKILDAILDYKTRLSAVSLIEFIAKQDWQSLISSRDRFRNYVQFLVTLLQHHAHSLLPMQNLGAQQLTANDLLRRLDFNGFYQSINQSFQK